MTKIHKQLLIDANVLIDYQKTNLSILQMAHKHIGEIQILTSIIAEVDGLDISKCTRLGFKICEPTLEQFMMAATQRGRLSFNDHLYLILARANDHICVTNDKCLRKACKEAGVSIRWGLEIMIELLRCHALTPKEAVKTAKEIHFCNPFHISSALLEKFIQAVHSIEKLP